MAITGIKGLANIKAKAEEKKGFEGDGESPFLSLKDGEAVKIRFLQEFDDSSAGYDDRRGTILVLNLHNSPRDFKIRAACTLDEENGGRCWACEQANTIADRDTAKKWRPKMRFFANVIVRGANDVPDKVKLLEQGFSGKNVGGDMLNITEEFEQLGGADCKLSRKGSGFNNTEYSLMPLAPKALSKDDQNFEVIDPAKFIKFVTYEQQADFYAGNQTEGGKSDAWV